eukprot:7091617-Pyramimonas_sp.AAC.1
MLWARARARAEARPSTVPRLDVRQTSGRAVGRTFGRIWGQNSGQSWSLTSPEQTFTSGRSGLSWGPETSGQRLRTRPYRTGNEHSNVPQRGQTRTRP